MCFFPLTDFVNGDDVAVTQACEAAGFRAEASKCITKDQVTGTKDLDGNVTTEGLLMYTVDNAHPTTTKLFAECVVLGKSRLGDLVLCERGWSLFTNTKREGLNSAKAIDHVRRLHFEAACQFVGVNRFASAKDLTNLFAESTEAFVWR